MLAIDRGCSRARAAPTPRGRSGTAWSPPRAGRRSATSTRTRGGAAASRRSWRSSCARRSGLDRGPRRGGWLRRASTALSYNLEASERHYDQIVSTHTWRDRVETVQLASGAMDTCWAASPARRDRGRSAGSGVCAARAGCGLGAWLDFLDARSGTPLAGRPLVEPGFRCARVMFRLIHRARICVGGRPRDHAARPSGDGADSANSIFTQGYPTTGGAKRTRITR